MPLTNHGSNQEQLSNWFATPVCQRVLQAEQRALIPLLTAHIGVRGVFLRADQGASAELSGNMLQQVCRLYPQRGQLAGDFVCEGEQLPIANESLSLIYVQHGFEQSANWPALIEEVARCLQPEAIFVAVVFSRISLFRTRWQRQALQAIDRHRFLRCCEASGLHIEERRAVGPGWPLLGGEGSLTESLGLGALQTSWAVVARKRRPGMMLIGPRRKLMFNPNATPT